MACVQIDDAVEFISLKGSPAMQAFFFAQLFQPFVQVNKDLKAACNSWNTYKQTESLKPLASKSS